jgi:ANTAR domain
VTEKQILFKISQIVGKSTNFSKAVTELNASLEDALGGRVLLLGMPDKSVAEYAEQFFDRSVGLPYRSVYTVVLRAGGRELGKLAAFFALGCLQEGMTQRLANFAGEQLGMLVERIHLTKERRQLLREYLATKDALATRIALQRAEGILAERRGLDVASARLWMGRQMAQQGVSLREAANKVVEEEQQRREARRDRLAAAGLPWNRRVAVARRIEVPLFS